jgi:hypothetical protein
VGEGGNGSAREQQACEHESQSSIELRLHDVLPCVCELKDLAPDRALDSADEAILAIPTGAA